MNDWHQTHVAPEGTHHLAGAAPLYAERFDAVLKFHAPGLAPVRRAGQAWHIDVEGRPAYAARFSRTFGFYEGLAAVESEDGWHHIRPDGSALAGERYAWCGNFQEGRCTVRTRDGRYLHLDARGTPVCPSRWRYAGDYRDGVAVVQGDDGLSTHVDAAGALLHGHWFLDLDVFHKGLARARDAGGWMHVDRAGRTRHGRRFAQVEPFYNGQARVERFDGGLEVIAEDGTTVCELRPARRSPFAALSADMVGFWRTQTLAAAVELGVPEALPGTAEEVAARCGLMPERARRLLRALGELGVALPVEGRWTLAEGGAYLRRDHPLTLADAAVEYARHLAPHWGALPEALRGDARWRPPDVFGAAGADAARRVAHHRMLRSYARHDYRAIVPVLGLSGHEVVIDAGGGTGAFAHLLLERHPGLQVVVLERPEVAAQVPVNEEGGRPSAVAADLFSPWPQKADVVVLARVLHDWDDAQAKAILRRACEALTPGGRVAVVEMLLDESLFDGGLCDLHLLAVTGGRERTAADFQALFTRAGLRLEAVHATPALPHVLLGVPQ